MNTKAVLAALLLLPLAGCGDETGSARAASHLSPPAQVSTYRVVESHDHAVFAVFAARQRRAQHRAELRAHYREEAREARERERRYRAIAESCPTPPAVHFDTPEAMMTYLADAWNRNDLGALCAVSNPDARTQLIGMHEEAENLRLDSCNKQQDGTYMCHFTHDYPARLHLKGHGEAALLAAPATKPGWYMSTYEGCG